jgi:hypothetical protein
MEYFNQCLNPTHVKKLFAELLMQMHPDTKPRDKFDHYNELTRVLIEQYHAALKGFTGFTSMGSDNKEHKYYYNEDLESKIYAVIEELIRLHMGADVKILIVGWWVWVEGNTKPHKDQLKTIKGLRYNGRRKVWQYNPFSYYRRSNHSNAHIKAVYGVEDKTPTDEKGNEIRSV